jgi:glycosyltransferase involved in cell wall biosynthesis
MKVAFVSTRGIPNHYGGLEEFAENVSIRLAKQGIEVIVYNPDFHPYRKNEFQGVKIRHIYSPEKKIGAGANFIYDFLSLRDALREQCDVILICGYTTAALSLLFLKPKKSVIITNIDGLEWKRSKHSVPVQKLTRWFEKIAVKKSSHVISDNMGIKEYVSEVYGIDSTFIAYAANPYPAGDLSLLSQFGLKPQQYFLLIGRLEPENNIEMILDGIAAAKDDTPVHLFAGTETSFAKYLMHKYKGERKIQFRGWLSGQQNLAVLRQHARLYFHGHSVGGTNPSLLEAMAAGAFIAAHDNVFNRYVLQEHALYFDTAASITSLIENLPSFETLRKRMAEANIRQIKEKYNWDKITEEYLELFKRFTQADIKAKQPVYHR